jgi:DNA-binding transcriptional LysR family regulator
VSVPTPPLAPSELEDMIFFVEVARALSFTHASKASGIPIATLSRRITLMEKRVGVRLFERTTRRLSLTGPGKRYQERCEQIVQDAAAAQEVLKEAAERLTGHLRISTPVELGFTLIAPIIDEFARQHPEITLEVDLTSRPANFVDDTTDVSIRLGEITHSQLVVRRLGEAARLFYASPVYLARHGEPKQPKDLSQHQCILQSYMAQPGVWHLVSGKKLVEVNVHGRFSTNNVSMTLKFAEQGHGIAALSPPIARQAFDSGAVRQILVDWSLPPMPVQAVMPSRLMPARVRAFVDFLMSRLTVT